MGTRSLVTIKRRPSSNHPILGFLASSILAILLYCPAAVPQTVFDARPGLIYYTEALLAQEREQVWEMLQQQRAPEQQQRQQQQQPPPSQNKKQ
jgi:hypothetical protein